jgi:hypothetical protein
MPLLACLQAVDNLQQATEDPGHSEVQQPGDMQQPPLSKRQAKRAAKMEKWVEQGSSSIRIVVPYMRLNSLCPCTVPARINEGRKKRKQEEKAAKKTAWQATKVRDVTCSVLQVNAGCCLCRISGPAKAWGCAHIAGCQGCREGCNARRGTGGGDQEVQGVAQARCSQTFRCPGGDDGLLHINRPMTSCS